MNCFNNFFLIIDLDEDVIKAFQNSRRIEEKESTNTKKESDDNDMSNCFGFDVSI